MGSSFIHLTRTDSDEFFLMAESYSMVYMYHSFLNHSSADGHLGCFHVLAICFSTSLHKLFIPLSTQFPRFIMSKHSRLIIFSHISLLNYRCLLILPSVSQICILLSSPTSIVYMGPLLFWKMITTMTSAFIHFFP